ncbi:MAG: hypothetical protein L0215_01985 [Gemmataceae bacterium]|nr:hypothetical protein [Gemmataceae bacterium]
MLVCRRRVASGQAECAAYFVRGSNPRLLLPEAVAFGLSKRLLCEAVATNLVRAVSGAGRLLPQTNAAHRPPAMRSAERLLPKAVRAAVHASSPGPLPMWKPGALRRALVGV